MTVRNNNKDNFNVSLGISTALHLVLLYFFFYGVPSFYNKLEEEVITFEVLPIGDISNVPNKMPAPEKKVEKKLEEKKEEIKQPKNEIKKAATQSAQEIKEKPVQEKPVVEEKTKEDSKIKDVVNIKDKNIPKKEPKPEPKKTKPQPAKAKPKESNVKPPLKKKKVAKVDLDSLLKNLEQGSESSESKTTSASDSGTERSKGPYNEDLPLSITETVALRQQIERHWNIPSGGEGLYNARVTLFIALDKEGNVTTLKLLNSNCGSIPQSACQAFVDSAIRAVKEASPIANLNPERYNVWKEFEFEFDPSRMLR